MKAIVAAGWILASFLLGSVPFAFLILRWRKGVDLRKHGSGNIGWTNAHRVGGARIGAVVFAADLLKGFLPVFLVRYTAGAVPPSWLESMILPVLAGTAAVAGHTVTPFLRGRGGRGVLTGTGMFLAIAPVATCAAFLVWVAVVAATRYVSLGSVLSVSLFAFWIWWSRFPIAPRVAATCLAMIVMLRHIPNIRRLIAGKENRFSWRRGASTDRKRVFSRTKSTDGV